MDSGLLRGISTRLSTGDAEHVPEGSRLQVQSPDRLNEACEIMRATFDLMVKLGNWKQASTAVGNLSELELTFGDIPADELPCLSPLVLLIEATPSIGE
jgi:hypothetical protein